VLLAFAALLTTSALILVEANQEQELTSTLLYLGLAYLGLFTVAHLVVRKLAPYADPLILPCAAVLNGLGLVMIHRVDLARADRAKQLGSPVPELFAGRQICLDRDRAGPVHRHPVVRQRPPHAGPLRLHDGLRRPGADRAARRAAEQSISEVNGAKIWLRLSIFSIQPGEFAKMLLMIFFAALLVSKRDLFTTAGRRVLGMEFPRPRDLAPMLVAWGVSVGVLVAGERPRHLAAVLRRRCWCCSTRPPSGCPGWSSA
jgi:hypothetical protein